MESVAFNNAQAVIKNLPVFAGRSKDTFHENNRKPRVCLSFYRKPVFEMFQGKAQPSYTTLSSTDTGTRNAGAEHKWQFLVGQPRSVKWPTSSASDSANNTVTKFEVRQPEDGAGRGQVAWKAPTEKHGGHTTEARRACHKKLVDTQLEPGQDRDDFVFVLDECRDFFE